VMHRPAGAPFQVPSVINIPEIDLVLDLNEFQLVNNTLSIICQSCDPIKIEYFLNMTMILPVPPSSHPS
jgi:hypothetical protein